MKSLLVNTVYAQGVYHEDTIYAIVIMSLLCGMQGRVINNISDITTPV